MARVIYKYELLAGAPCVDVYDTTFSAARCVHRAVPMPFNALILHVGVQVDPHAPVDTVMTIVAWCAVDEVVAMQRSETRHFWFAYTGGPWPERSHLATLEPTYINHDRASRRIVHVFGGGV